MTGTRYNAALKVEHVHSFDVRAIIRAIRGGQRALRHPSDAHLRAEGLTLHVGGRSTVGAAVTLDGPAESGSLRLAWSNVGREGHHTRGSRSTASACPSVASAGGPSALAVLGGWRSSMTWARAGTAAAATGWSTPPPVMTPSARRRGG